MNLFSKSPLTNGVMYYGIGLLGILFWFFVGFWLLSFAGVSLSPKWVEAVSGEVIAVYLVFGLLTACAMRGARAWAQELTEKSNSRMVRTTEDRLDELERLKRRDMVTPEEYAAKRQEILKDL